jgi:opacity protein-like surface antigen
MIRILWIVMIGLLSSTSFAWSLCPFRPVVALAVAAQSPIFTQTSQNLVVLPPFQNTYISTNGGSIPIVGNFLVGIERPLRRKLKWQLGFSYYRAASFVMNGTVLQFHRPDYDNLDFNYRVQTTRYLLETKILGTFKQILHPYITGGIGVTSNHSYGYKEHPTASAMVPMLVRFTDHTRNGFAYMGGAGADLDIVQHLRLGLRFQYAGLAGASLGPIPNQIVPDALTASGLRSNEYILQLTYIF